MTTELEVISVLAARADIRRTICVPNVTSLGLNWEADLLCVTPAGYITEYEVKVTKADLMSELRGGAKTNKHARLKRGASPITKFFYAVTPGVWYVLKDEEKALIHELYGIVVVDVDARTVDVVREAGKLHDRPCKSLPAQFYRLCYLRYWTLLNASRSTAMLNAIERLNYMSGQFCDDTTMLNAELGIPVDSWKPENPVLPAANTDTHTP